ncbi:hypothetical protein U2150_01810 [Methanothermobacter wolfeii]|uniref:Uncharacterized protein n=1 Tax=Methanothermobacter wolfeii TaxID=145261 RepID=A0ABU8TT50_METWO|nr:hypothetical protein [Methanothermobacter sp. THM-1]
MNRITCLVEDKPSHTLMGEHGLSLYIEGERDILFDTGQSSLFAENASILGLELGVQMLPSYPMDTMTMEAASDTSWVSTTVQRCSWGRGLSGGVTRLKILLNGS